MVKTRKRDKSAKIVKSVKTAKSAKPAKSVETAKSAKSSKNAPKEREKKISAKGQKTIQVSSKNKFSTTSPKSEFEHSKNQESGCDRNSEESEYESEEEEDQRNQERKKFVITLISATIAFVIVAILVVLFVIFSFIFETKTKETEEKTPFSKTTKPNRPPIKILDTKLTELCQTQSICRYFNGKYVDNCVGAYCDSLNFHPDVPNKLEDQYKLEFLPHFYTLIEKKSRLDQLAIEVPHGTLCKTDDGYGFCSNWVCVKNESILQYDVDAIEPVHGGWSNYSSQLNDFCVEANALTDSQTLVWKIIEQRISSDRSCNQHCYYETRKCNNPAPARGGKLCWKDTREDAYIKWYDWPLRVSPRCTTCLNRFMNKTCNEKSTKGTCFGKGDSVNALDNNYCCLPNIELPPGKAHPGAGICIAKACVPVNFT